MKKLILSVAILSMSLASFAGNNKLENEVVTVSKVTNEYIEIKITELPSAIPESLKISHPNAVIIKAYVNENKQYKLDLVIGNKTETVLTDVNGVIAGK